MCISDCKTVGNRSQPGDGTIRVLSDDGSKTIGIIRDLVFIKSNWHSTKHLCRKHNAIGLDRASFLNYVEPFATLIVVPDKDTGREYRVSVEHFKTFSLDDDLGWGPQMFLQLEFFEVIEPDGSKPVQLTLW